MFSISLSRIVRACVLVFCLIGQAIPAVTEAQRIARLEMLADLWGKLYLFHPRVVEGKLDWSRVLVEAIPKVEAARDDAALIDVLNNVLLRPLDDPLTLAQGVQTMPAASEHEIASRRIAAEIGYVDATDPRSHRRNGAAKIESAIHSLGPVSTLIIDLRFSTTDWADLDWLQMFLKRPQTSGALVSRVHQGWNEDNATKRQKYEQTWNIKPGEPRRPIGKADITAGSIVFIANNSSYAQAAELLDVLQANGAMIVLEQRGRFTPRYPRLEREGNFYRVQYLNSIEIRFTTSMLLSKSGSLGPQPDFEAADSLNEQQLVGLAESLPKKRKGQAIRPAHPFSGEMVFAGPQAPSLDLSREERLTALFKMWTVVCYFDPHLGNASIDWLHALPAWIPKLEGAKAYPEYIDVLQQLTATLNDGHVVVRPQGALLPELRSRVRRRVIPGMRLEPAEGRPIVVETKSGPYGDPALHVGDEILKIDGKSIDELFAQDRPRISASQQALLRRLAARLLFGPFDKEAVEIVFQNDTGQHSVMAKTVVASDSSLTQTARQPAARPFKVLEDRFGYLKIDNFTDGDVEPTLSAMRTTHGLILDMRGYPNKITDFPAKFFPYIAVKDLPGPIAERPFLSTPDLTWRGVLINSHPIQAHPTRRFTKPMVVLIDERTQSYAEEVCIFLRNAKRATFVGTTTSGANGSVGQIDLPGGLMMSFTGYVVKFSDGSRFQNVGVVPEVRAERTIRGIREGRDEVLEKGVETLKALVGREKAN